MAAEQTTKVLLVEDNPELLNREQSFLSRRGWEILTAPNGIEAIKLATEEKPHIIILDIYIPKVDGLEVLKWIHSQSFLSTSKVIALVPAAHKEDNRKVKQIGCDELLTKPVSREALLGAIINVSSVKVRAEPRAQLKILVNGYRRGERFDGRSLNIGAGGIYLRTEKRFPPGSEAELFFTLPGTDKKIRAQGRLLRVEKLSNGKGSFGLAFQFTSLEKIEKEEIRKAVAKKEKKKE